MARVEAKGMGLQLSVATLTEDELITSVREVIDNNNYRMNAQRLSDILRDQPMRPTEKAAFWVEHVIKHDGAAHLRSQAHRLTFVQYYLIDVFAFIIMMFIVVVLVLKTLFSYVCKACGVKNRKIKIKEN
ncbi:UDP-glucuronosyltransferase 2A3-like [Glandiceps talaboti]